jgi:hypothetical protein
MHSRHSLFALAAALAASLTVSACDDAEQGRILRYEQGVYLGKPDTPLTREAKENIRVRQRLQMDR